jgi:2-oxoglutarate ferredoxin oxidoreductase subunit delta
MPGLEKFIIKINSERCKGCELCVSVCPRQIIKMSQETNQIGYAYAEISNEGKCIGCLNCTTVCPDYTIEIKK